MMRRMVGLSLLLAFTLTVPLCAQSASELQRGPDENTRSTTPGIEVLPYTGLPFYGTDTIVKIHPLSDGGSIIISETSKVARDTQGRTYRERHKFAPEGTDPQKTIFEFYVLDPIAHTRTTCTIELRVCMVTDFHPHTTYNLMPAGAFDNGRQFLARESLGQQTINDLPAVGTLETTTISPGTVGNDRPITLVREFWYSTDLKTNLSVNRSDPREGLQKIRLDVQSRSEPDPSFFTVPTGYAIKDTRSSHHQSLN